MIKRILSFCIIFLMCLSSMCVTVNAQTATSWTEDFSNGIGNWASYGYATVPTSGYARNFTAKENSGYKIQNGMLVSGFNYDKDDTGLGNMSFIFHSSAFQEGNFSFDTFIANWTTTKQDFEVNAMISEPNSDYNFLNKTAGDVFTNTISLRIQGAYGYHRIQLWNGFSNAGSYNVPASDYNSFHHILISINSIEGTNVSMDNKNIITSLSTPTFQSQKFGFDNRDGFSMFDNISVEGTPATTTTSQATPGYEFMIVIPAMIALTLLFNKIKKRTT